MQVRSLFVLNTSTKGVRDQAALTSGGTENVKEEERFLKYWEWGCASQAYKNHSSYEIPTKTTGLIKSVPTKWLLTNPRHTLGSQTNLHCTAEEKEWTKSVMRAEIRTPNNFWYAEGVKLVNILICWTIPFCAVWNVSFFWNSIWAMTRTETERDH